MENVKQAPEASEFRNLLVNHENSVSIWSRFNKFITRISFCECVHWAEATARINGWFQFLSVFILFLGLCCARYRETQFKLLSWGTFHREEAFRFCSRFGKVKSIAFTCLSICFDYNPQNYTSKLPVAEKNESRQHLITCNAFLTLNCWTNRWLVNRFRFLG